MRRLHLYRLILVVFSLALAGCGSDDPPAPSCEETVCGGSCVDIDSDPLHCGGCGNACESDEACEEGACVVSCSDGGTVCAGSCVDLESDRRNCGRCGVVCSGDRSCVEGSCVCSDDETFCGSSCVDTFSDPAHCGGCGMACAFGEVCVDGACSAECREGSIECDGVCVNPNANAAHCGGCGVVCEGGRVCDEGTCACPAGQELCGDRCVDTSTSLQHCGACDAACVVGENAVEGTCVEGFCVLECEPGTFDCNSDPADGCETHVDSDADHCSACGNACGEGERCEMGICCGPDHLVCGVACIDPETDAAHCGDCGVSCEVPAGATTAACIDGACTFTCAEGFADCNGDPADGCEVDLLSDRTHCGSCGNECPALCGEGACVGVTLAHSSLATTCVLADDGSVHCWGYNGEGQVGDGTFQHRASPQPVPIGPAAEIVVGPYHTCARSVEGTVLCWGANVSGELGAGDTLVHTTPVTAMNGTLPLDGVEGLALTGVLSSGQISLPVSSTCALLSSGRVMCWGAGANGRLGDGTTADRVSPAFVLTQGVPLENVVQIAAGHGHVCARQQSGTVHCWGANAQGQLGVGDEVDRLEATPVPGLAGVDEIAAGGMRTCARTGGTVQCWGTNAQGQIGDGTQVASNVPVSVSGLTDATALRLAQNHGFARRQDGTWVGWGMGWSGEVRHGGSPGFILAPVPVVEPGETTTWQGLQSVLAGGHSYGCAVDGDGVTWCWGNNQYGQLGDGAVGGSRSNPEPVKW